MDSRRFSSPAKPYFVWSNAPFEGHHFLAGSFLIFISKLLWTTPASKNSHDRNPVHKTLLGDLPSGKLMAKNSRWHSLMIRTCIASFANLIRSFLEGTRIVVMDLLSAQRRSVKGYTVSFNKRPNIQQCPENGRYRVSHAIPLQHKHRRFWGLAIEDECLRRPIGAPSMQTDCCRNGIWRTW